MRVAALLFVAALSAPLHSAAGPTSVSRAADRALDDLVRREEHAARDHGDLLAATSFASARTRGTANASALDAEHATHDIELDPLTGTTAGRLELRVRAKGRALGAVGWVLDEGLVVEGVTVAGARATLRQEVVSPSRVVEVELDPALEAGHSTTLQATYRGTLQCGSSRDGGAVVCTTGDAFSYFGHQSIFPSIFDPSSPTDPSVDVLTRDIVLRVPRETEVVATGEKVGETIDGARRVSRWSIGEPVARSLGLYAFAGRLGTKDVQGRSVPTTLVFPAPEQAVDRRLVEWSTPVLDFVEKLGGSALPFRRSMTLVRLPADVGDPGTATFGMTLLSDSYARAGDMMHEETWAHENAHLFFGIVVPEKRAASRPRASRRSRSSTTRGSVTSRPKIASSTSPDASPR